jgi:energy-coupling factor transport system ATP-binding protein
VINGLSLRVQPGEWLAVMGASDAGKTTLCLLLSGLAPHLTGGRVEGHITIAGRDTRQTPPPDLAATVGLLFQEPEAQLFSATVEAEVAWGLENLGLPVAEINQRVSDMLALFHLEHVRHRAPGQLSGGEKKRLALASVLAMQPALLILDEPMGGLDPAGRDQVLATLAALRRDRSMTIVMAESDPEAVAAFADRLVVLDRGGVALEGAPRTLFREVDSLAPVGVAAPQMGHLAANLNRRLATGFDFLTVDEARQALLSFAQQRGGIGSGHASPPPRPPSALSAGSSPEEEGGLAAELYDLRFGYDESIEVLRGLNLRVPRGQFVALVGANGSGKTTLVKHINGLLRPLRGRVSVFGQDTAGRSVGELARQVGFLFQHPEQQIFGGTVRQELAFGPRNLGLLPHEVQARVEAALIRFELLAVADHAPAILSYGLRRRVTLASLAAMDPPLLILDEPSVGLDAPGLAETLHWLAELHARGRTIVLVTHDMALAAQYPDRVVVLHEGRILADGLPADIFRQTDTLTRASLVPPPVVALARALRPHGLRGDGLSVDSFCTEYTAWLEGEW